MRKEASKKHQQSIRNIRKIIADVYATGDQNMLIDSMHTNEQKMKE